jgi:hypothetical protein
MTGKSSLNTIIRWLFFGALLIAPLFILVACGNSNTPAQTTTPTPTVSPITTATPTQIKTSTPIGSPITTATPTQIKTPTPIGSPTTTAWSADGLITSNEYSNSVTYGSGVFEINWETDAQYIYVGIKAKTTGWVALGFNANSQLKNVDYVFGWVSNGKAYIADEFSGDFHGQHQTDESLGGKDNITDYGGQEKDGYTIIEFKRALISGDIYDANLSSGDVPIIWSYGSSDDISMIHSSHGTGHLKL